MLLAASLPALPAFVFMLSLLLALVFKASASLAKVEATPTCKAGPSRNATLCGRFLVFHTLWHIVLPIGSFWALWALRWARPTCGVSSITVL